MRRRLALGFSLVALTALVGCLRVPSGLAPSNTPLGARQYTVTGPAFGTDTATVLFGIIPITAPDNTQRAIDQAVANAGADALIDVTVETVSKYYIIFSTYTIEVRGKAIKYNK